MHFQYVANLSEQLNVSIFIIESKYGEYVPVIGAIYCSLWTSQDETH